MPRLRKLGEKPDNHDRWLLTYADLITLLLAFFIVMYSMSRIDAKKFGSVALALQGVLHGRTEVLDKQKVMRGDPSGGGAMKTGDLRLMQAKLRQAIQDAGMENKITPIIDERGLVVHVTESALFDQGSADLQDRARPPLDLVAKALQGLATSLRIEGHTDSRPISTGCYPSNWELSTARAATVVRYFILQHGWSPDHISALGYGEFRPLAPNNSSENMAKNRRVDVVVLTANLSLSEPAGLQSAPPDTMRLQLPSEIGQTGL